LSQSIEEADAEIQQINARLDRAWTGLRFAASKLDDTDATILGFFLMHGVLPNIESPRSFSEKIQYRKLYDKRDIIPRLSDKILVKEFVRNVMGSEWITETLWSGVSISESDLKDLPLPLVIKSNFGSGNNIFLNDISNIEDVVTQANRWKIPERKTVFREWASAQIDMRILVEENINPTRTPLKDFKFFTFKGEVKAIQVDSDRFGHHTRDFFAPNWRRMNMMLEKPRSDELPARPRHLEKMLNAAAMLGRDFDFVRVDLYDLPDHPRFGEMTFYPGSGFERFRPASVDSRFGAWWTLP
jgi:hypothetical protein